MQTDPAYPRNFERLVFLILGFTQRTTSLTGIEKVWRVARQWATPLDSKHPTHVATPRLWDDDWEGTAAFIARNAIAEPIVDIVGYSWGAGHGAMELARELELLGLPVTRMVLADPVYRSPWLPTWLPANPLSMTGIPSITVPGNVGEVWWTRQYNNKPAGHNLVAAKDSTVINPAEVRKELDHDQMDDDPYFKEMALAVLGEAR